MEPAERPGWRQVIIQWSKNSWKCVHRVHSFGQHDSSPFCKTLRLLPRPCLKFVINVKTSSTVVVCWFVLLLIIIDNNNTNQGLHCIALGCGNTSWICRAHFSWSKLKVKKIMREKMYSSVRSSWYFVCILLPLWPPLSIYAEIKQKRERENAEMKTKLHYWTCTTWFEWILGFNISIWEY